MSKKIIYLLSLLMALSLVFASCKKNSVTDGLGDIGTPPDQGDNTGGLIDESGDRAGLVTDDQFDQLPADKYLKKSTIFKGDANNYIRNPVIVVMGANRNIPVVFAEKRYNGPGSENDVGIDGKATVDVIYKVGEKAGQNFGAETKVGVGSTGPEDSHGAPVVFRVNDNQVVVVASAGAGIARTTEAAGSKVDSRIDYIIGDFANNTFTWGNWQEVQLTSTGDLLTAVKKIQTGNKTDVFDQMGTQAARGVITDSKLILPVIMAQQATLGSPKELMGVYFLKGTVSGKTVQWENLESNPYIVFNAKSPSTGFSQYKETQVIAATGFTSVTGIKYIAVPSPWGSPATDNYGLGNGKDQLSGTQIKGHDGAPGYLALTWYGAGKYQPSTYKNDNPDKALFLGVKNNAKNITLYLVNKDTLAKEGKADGFELNAIGKSGSIDVLGDGTVVTAAEEGSNGERNYYTSFTRYSQSYLNSILGAQ